MAGTAAASAPIGRLSKEDRREQLLDAAVEIVVERGVAALTMEGLAERAGVSKALPYQHFDNAGAVLIALYGREIGLLGRRVYEAVDGIADPEARVRAAIHTYFDVVAERGRVLGAFTGAASAVESDADRGVRTGVEFVALLLVKPFGFHGRRAKMLASIFLGALAGATESWAYGDGGRERVERTLTAVIIGGLREARERE
jgi:AcrR family transcriptional regulator